MIKIYNPFCFIVALLQFGACIWYWKFILPSSPKLAILMFLYALTNIVISLMKGI